jgi:hypothetical protein
MDSIAPGTVIVTSMACTPPATSASTTPRKDGRLLEPNHGDDPFALDARCRLRPRHATFATTSSVAVSCVALLVPIMTSKRPGSTDPLHAPIDQRELVGSEP